MMKFSKLVASLSVASIALALLAAPAFGQPQGIASSELHQVNQSGVRAELLFLDSGSMMTVSGRATGLDPSVTYRTLIYDLGSVPGGPATLGINGACEPSSFPPPLPTQMLIGVWTVDGDGNGVLFAVKTGIEYTPLGTFDTVSIRVAPGVEGVRACGQVNAHITRLP